MERAESRARATRAGQVERRRGQESRKTAVEVPSMADHSRRWIRVLKARLSMMYWREESGWGTSRERTLHTRDPRPHQPIQIIIHRDTKLCQHTVSKDVDKRIL